MASQISVRTKSPQCEWGETVNWRSWGKKFLFFRNFHILLTWRRGQGQLYEETRQGMWKFRSRHTRTAILWSRSTFWSSKVFVLLIQTERNMFKEVEFICGDQHRYRCIPFPVLSNLDRVSLAKMPRHESIKKREFHPRDHVNEFFFRPREAVRWVAFGVMCGCRHDVSLWQKAQPGPSPLKLALDPDPGPPPHLPLTWIDHVTVSTLRSGCVHGACSSAEGHDALYTCTFQWTVIGMCSPTNCTISPFLCRPAISQIA